MSKKHNLPILAAVLVLLCLTLTISNLPKVSAATGNTAMISMGSGDRWRDVADQLYVTSYRASYDSEATVMVSYENAGSKLSGTLTASNLKPNFAYQIKLVGTPGTADNEQIGYAGSWWQEEWNGATWTNGQNINDATYQLNVNTLYDGSTTQLKYRITGYLLFAYFLTDKNGGGTVSLSTGNSYHVLWKTSQRTPTSNDGPTITTTFQPTNTEPAYLTDYPSNTISVFGEYERLPKDQINIGPGLYSCQIVLTEESFHGSGGTYAGNWATVMTGTLNFAITPTLPLPEYQYTGLAAILSFFGAFMLFKTRNTLKIPSRKLHSTYLEKMPDFMILGFYQT